MNETRIEAYMDEQKHTMTMLVDNEPGVLSRVAGLFSGKGFNIESLCTAPTMDPRVSRITIVTKANPPLIEQIEKQLRKLINVIKLRDMTGPRSVKREMALICVTEHYIIEVTGDEAKLAALINLLKPMGIKKIARSGTLALYREPK
jgi:acetolactate synthase-1/3 small subunit